MINGRDYCKNSFVSFLYSIITYIEKPQLVVYFINVNIVRFLYKIMDILRERLLDVEMKLLVILLKFKGFN